MFSLPILYLSVVIHELTHYIVAKILNVKVLIVSVGSGKKLLEKKIYGTSFRFFLNPFSGGYNSITRNNAIANYKAIPLILITAPIINLIIGIAFCFLEQSIFLLIGYINLNLFLISMFGSDGINTWKIITKGLPSIMQDE